MPATQALPRSRTWMLALLLTLPLGATAQPSTISTNLRVDFLRDFSFSAGLDTSLALDLAVARSRLVNTRLGDWQGLSLSMTYSHSYSFSAIDPGVAEPPLANRNLLRIDNQVSFGGPLLGDGAVVSRLLNTWFCPAPSLKCSSTAVGTSRSETLNPVMPATMAAAADRLSAVPLTGSSSTEILTDGASAVNGMTRVSGFIRLDANYLAKAPLAYASDALQSSAATAPATRSLRMAAAVSDLQALRQGQYSSVPDTPFSRRVGLNPEMQQGQALLVGARDSAGLLEAAGPGAAQYSTGSNLTRQLWDVLALGDPLLGRQQATSTLDTVNVDATTQLATFRSVLAGGNDDASFLAGLSAALAQTPVGGDTPLMVLDGQLFGAPGAQLSVYFTPENGSGDFAFSLPAAERHALWRTGYDRLTLLEGVAPLGFSAGNFGSGQVGLGDSEYIGEFFNGVLLLDGGSKALRIELNNFYSPRFLVVASWNVSAVPEPATWVSLAGGMLLLAWRRRRGAGKSEHR